MPSNVANSKAKVQSHSGKGYYFSIAILGVFLMTTSVTVIRLKQNMLLPAHYAVCNVVKDTVNCDVH